jgi:hypothetical protein
LPDLCLFSHTSRYLCTFFNLVGLRARWASYFFAMKTTQISHRRYMALIIKLLRMRVFAICEAGRWEP